MHLIYKKICQLTKHYMAGKKCQISGRFTQNKARHLMISE